MTASDQPLPFWAAAPWVATAQLPLPPLELHIQYFFFLPNLQTGNSLSHNSTRERRGSLPSSRPGQALPATRAGSAEDARGRGLRRRPARDLAAVVAPVSRLVTSSSGSAAGESRRGSEGGEGATWGVALCVQRCQGPFPRVAALARQGFARPEIAQVL